MAKAAGKALQRIEPDDGLTSLAGSEIRTPEAFAERVATLRDRAHVLSPMAAVATIAPSHTINTMVVPIDTSIDPESGVGAEVYFQPSIHRFSGSGTNKKPTEVSLNKYGLLRILQASGADVYPSERLDDGREQYLWIVRTQADVLGFDGSRVRLPAGTASVDLRDGSADIGGWTPKEWNERLVAEQAKYKAADQWKAKPRSINGWTLERVIGARRFGYRLAETKSLNALARNLGVRQKYTLDELRKPFVIFRASYVPDTSDPEVRRMLTAASLGATRMLYGGGQADVTKPQTHAFGDVHNTIAGELVAATSATETVAPPPDTDDATFSDDAAETPNDEVFVGYVVTGVKVRRDRDPKQYFIEATRRDGESATLYTTDPDAAKACYTAYKQQASIACSGERVAVDGGTYLQIVEWRAVTS